MIEQYHDFIRRADLCTLPGKLIQSRDNPSRVLEIRAVLPRNKLAVAIAPRWWDGSRSCWRPWHEGSEVDEAQGSHVAKNPDPTRDYIPSKGDILCDTPQEADSIILWFLEEERRLKAFAEERRQAFNRMIGEHNAGLHRYGAAGPEPD